MSIKDDITKGNCVCCKGKLDDNEVISCTICKIRDRTIRQNEPVMYEHKVPLLLSCNNYGGTKHRVF